LKNIEILGSIKLHTTYHETLIKVGSEHIWLWIAIETDNLEIIQISINGEKDVCSRQFYMKPCEKICRTSCVSTGGGTWYPP
jgi:transposase-like protein